MYGWDENWIQQSGIKPERRTIRKLKCERELDIRKDSTVRMRMGVDCF
jgi:hypothetical protein